MKKKIFFTIITVILTIGMYAATYTVNPTTPSIQGVIIAASDGDIIEFESGTYTLTSMLQIGNGITLRSINGSSTTIIDGNNTTRCFFVNHPSAVIEGFTIQNARGNTIDKHGGGARIGNGGTIQDCIFQNNYGQDGGGVAIDATGGYLLNCIIKNNTAVWGGGVRLFGGEVRNCLIVGNTGTGHGGGVNIYTAGNVYNCTITNNTSPDGGGVRLWNVSNVGNNIIYNNSTTNLISTGSGDILFHNYTSDPLFIGANDFHLQSGSGCINSGQNALWMTTSFDLDGNDRIFDDSFDIVDKGCYEFIPIIDTDNDGIEDSEDDFPNDPDRAFVNYFPAAGYGSLGFEDLWPGKGDYDFNDVVVDYRFATITNAQDYVVDITATFVAKASGAFYHNGFGFNLPLANSALNTDLIVAGSDLQESYINLKGNGLEDAQTHPTVIVFDDIYNSLPHPGSGIGVNTEDGAPFVPFDTITIVMTPVQDTYDANDFNLLEWNPFIIVDRYRSREVHLKDKAPTDLINFSELGTIEDDSNPGSGRYYVTTNNLPWAIELPSSFDWPKEKVAISLAYLHFIEWAESLGTLETTWYEDLPGNRNSSLIYQVP